MEVIAKDHYGCRNFRFGPYGQDKWDNGNGITEWHGYDCINIKLLARSSQEYEKWLSESFQTDMNTIE